MCPYVPLQGTRICAGVVALFASKRFLSTVNQHVGFQLGSSAARVATLVASVSLLSTMLQHVRFKIFILLEGEIALTT